MDFTDGDRAQHVAFFFPHGQPERLTLEVDFSERALEEMNCALEFLNRLADLAWEQPSQTLADYARQLEIPVAVLRQWWAVYYLGGYDGLRDLILQQPSGEYHTRRQLG